MRGTAAMNGIRDAKPDDAEAIAAIYAHHVLNGTASYDVVPPPVEYHRAKIKHILERGWPFLIAGPAGDVAGYAYATQFRDREGYRFTAEDSIYVHPNQMRQGIGGSLLDALIARCVEGGFLQLIAVIGGAEPGSIAVHAKRGFREVGRLHSVGWKQGRWLDSVYMQLELSRRGD
jgi:phosphinothricin acetyltransferase